MASSREILLIGNDNAIMSKNYDTYYESYLLIVASFNNNEKLEMSINVYKYIPI